jgi:hypothetical protein
MVVPRSLVTQADQPVKTCARCRCHPILKKTSFVYLGNSVDDGFDVELVWREELVLSLDGGLEIAWVRECVYDGLFKYGCS